MEKHQTKCDFEAIFYGMVDWVWELDSNWIYTMVDGNIHEKTKYSTDELINHSFFSFFPEILQRHVKNVFEDSIKQLKPIKNLECKMLCKDTSHITVLIHGNAIFNEQKEFVGFKGVAQDITAQKQREEEIVNTNILYEFALDLSNAGSWYVDFEKAPDHFFISKKLAEVYGEKWSDNLVFLIKDWFDNILKTNEELGLKVIEDWYDVFTSLQSNIEMVCQYTKNDGQVVWIYSKAKVIRDNEGKVMTVFGVTRDITDSKIREQELLDQEKKFRTLFEHSVDAIVIVDPVKMRYVDCNKRAYETMGYLSKA